ncbi:hypothetical protein V2J09_000417 [Rumex salicifolius]
MVELTLIGKEKHYDEYEESKIHFLLHARTFFPKYPPLPELSLLGSTLEPSVVTIAQVRGRRGWGAVGFMAGWLESNDVPVGNCDEKSRGNCNCRDGSVCQKSIGHDHEDECGIPFPGVMFDQAALVLLRRLYAKNSIRPVTVSLGYSQSVDLYRLFCLVREKGGFDSVSRGHLWGLIAKHLDLDFRVTASLKMLYFNKLADLDQWLDSIGKDWNSKKMSDEYGRNLELLSIELEKRIKRVLFVDAAKLVKIEKGAIPAGCDQIRDHMKVASKENEQIPMVKEDNGLLDNGNIANNEGDEKMREKEANTSVARADPDFVESESTCKRKRDGCEEMLSWLKKIAKNPSQISKLGMLNSSKWRENGGNEYLSVALLMRVAMLKRKYSNSKGNQCCLHQKQKIHPSLYDDPATCHLSGIRFSKRVPALVKSPKCPCCVSKATKEGKTDNHSIAGQPENDSEYDDDKAPDSPASSSSEQTDGSSPDKLPVKKRVNVGRQYQAEIPSFTGGVSESDSKWLGTQVWAPDILDCKIVTIMQLVLGEGRPDKCDCPIPGTVECVRFHTMENNLKLKRELGRAFYQWKLDRIGETISLSWTPQEEEDFKSVMCATPLSMGKSYFPNKTRQEMVDYYFNVFLQRRRSYQNRVTPNAIDSDDELSDFGSVGGLYGHVATHTNPGICNQK